ncbi:MAG: CPBP family intramembrane metalloprotease [Alphaproteobacteria bacterium]|nr:CPBP family intramembrane metalloprotease [Alphaproteobacteria bacterium]
MDYAFAAAILLLLAWFVRNDAAEYAAFKALTDTIQRQREFQRWTLRSFLFFFAGAVVVLALLGRIDALWRMPPEFAPLARVVAMRLSREDHFLLFVIGGAFGGGLLGASLAPLLKKRRAPEPVVIGDIAPLMPRNAMERRWTALLALNAGPAEEVFFRLLLPLVFTLATGRPLAAFIVAGVVFGLVHFYQGWAGIVGTMVVGALLACLYLAAGTIWVPAILHSLMNLNSLWLRPWLASRADRRLSA